jgi:hypothetical protein
MERGFFPTAFRSGWVWENNELSRWLEEIIPFDFSANPPNQSKGNLSEPIRNCYDWSRAPREFSGYHPRIDDYQEPGRMRRWIFRTISPNSRRQWERIFRAASTGDDQILCYASHSYDNLPEDIEKFLPKFLKLADSSGLKIVFASATEAGAALSKFKPGRMPRLEIREINKSIIIQVNEPVFQRHPYCVVTDSVGLFRRINPVPSGINEWNCDSELLPGDKIITCAASTLAGQSNVTSLELAH